MTTTAPNPKIDPNAYKTDTHGPGARLSGEIAGGIFIAQDEGVRWYENLTAFKLSDDHLEEDFVFVQMTYLLMKADSHLYG